MRIGGRAAPPSSRNSQASARAVERPGRAAHDEVWNDPALIERAEDPDLDRTDAPATGQDEGDGLALAHVGWRL